MKHGHISIWFYLWVPLIFLVGQVIAELSLPRELLQDIHSENGLHEISQFAVISFAFLAALSGLFQVIIAGRFGLAIWMIAAALGSLYVAGEEISWGQHFFGWETGELFQKLNDQGETNLHNMSSWFDQKPRLILELAVMVGGIAIPVLLKAFPDAFPKSFNYIYPPLILVPVAAMTASLKIADKILEMNDIIFFTRVSEVIELYVFYYVLLYLVNLNSQRKLALL